VKDRGEKEREQIIERYSDIIFETDKDMISK
jgi:hypothetical protein